MTDLLEQITAIRDSGETNMLNSIAVQRIAHERDYCELVCFIEDHRAEYAKFICSGDVKLLEVE